MFDILAIGAHPDDIEFACGGILAKMAAQGKSIAMADLTLGEKGTNGTPHERHLESKNAADIIGAKRTFLDFKDCEIFDTFEGRLKLTKLIREYQPRLVIAPLWKGEGNHPDHVTSGQMARYACRYARFAKILPNLPCHWVEGILHYPPSTYERVDFIVDVSDYVEPWKKMMQCHASQMLSLDYVDRNLKLAAKLGTLIERPYAQGLIKGNPVVVNDVLAIAKMQREI